MVTVVIGWGRFNPPTTGHEKLIKKIATEAKSRKADFRVFPTKSNDPKKNPLTFKTKVSFMKKLYPKYAKNISPDGNIKTILDVAKKMDKKYSDFVLVVGSDRISEFTSLLNKYNGKDYDFENIQVVSAGDRDPDAKDVSGMSASKMRRAADGDFAAFRQGVTVKKVAKDLFNAVRKGMKINERFEKDGIFDAIEALKEDANFSSARFNTLLRFGLSPGGTGDIPLTKRAFKNFDKAQTSPPLRERVFAVTDNAFEYMLEDDLLYNRFLMLLQRSQLFGENMIDHDFDTHLTETNVPLNYVASFGHRDICKRFIKETKGIADVNWVSSNGMEIQFSTTEPAEILPLIQEAKSEMHLFEGDIREGILVEIEDSAPSIQESIQIKADKSDIEYDILAKVYVRGLDSWGDDCETKTKLTAEQWAYNRLNSFISNGRAREQDLDLWEEHLTRTDECSNDIDDAFESTIGAN